MSYLFIFAALVATYLIGAGVGYRWGKDVFEVKLQGWKSEVDHERRLAMHLKKLLDKEREKNVRKD